jgi:hypothetical protein
MKTFSSRILEVLPPQSADTPVRAALSISGYPNPFNPETTITYTLPTNGRATIAVYDAKGASVNTLFDGEQQAGTHVVQWSGLDAAGYRAGSGVLLCARGFGAVDTLFQDRALEIAVNQGLRPFS